MKEMYQIQLKFMDQTKKITVAKSLSTHELSKLIAHSFRITDHVVGITDHQGKFYELNKLTAELSDVK